MRVFDRGAHTKEKMASITIGFRFSSGLQGSVQYRKVIGLFLINLSLRCLLEHMLLSFRH